MSEETVESRQGTEKKRSNRSLFKILIVIIIVAVFIAAGYFFMKQSGDSVAMVNGQKILRSVYDERYVQLAASITSQGQSATSTEMREIIKTQTFDNLVAETILLQAADKEGYKVNKEEVDALFSQNKSQFSDEAAFKRALSAQGYTDTTFKNFLTRQNIIRQYLLAHIDLMMATASEAEVKALYDQAASSDPSVPPLDQVLEQVKNQIIQQKQQAIISGFVEQLRASSTIEKLI